jgi:hypothetical protein
MTETPEITDEALHEFMETEPTYHTILQVWREILKEALPERRDMKMGPRWANRLVQSYPELRYDQLIQYATTYYDQIVELLNILDFEIATDDECLNPQTAEEDVEANSAHYLNILIEWQRALLSWELAWDCTLPDAAVKLAAMSETHRMMFGDTGVTSLLDQIGFSLTDDDQAAIAEALIALSGGEDE